MRTETYQNQDANTRRKHNTQTQGVDTNCRRSRENMLNFLNKTESRNMPKCYEQQSKTEIKHGDGSSCVNYPFNGPTHQKTRKDLDALAAKNPTDHNFEAVNYLSKVLKEIAGRIEDHNSEGYCDQRTHIETLYTEQEKGQSRLWLVSRYEKPSNTSKNSNTANTEENFERIKEKLNKERNMWKYQKQMQRKNSTENGREKHNWIQDCVTEVSIKHYRKPNKQRHYEALQEWRGKNNPNTALVVFRKKDREKLGNLEKPDFYIAEIEQETAETGAGFLLIPEESINYLGLKTEQAPFQTLNLNKTTVETALKLYSKTTLSFETCIEIAEHL